MNCSLASLPSVRSKLLAENDVTVTQTKALKTQIVTSRSAGETIRGFLASPGDIARHGAIIAIHEWWGLNEWVKKQARELAVNGYVVLAVDLYRGIVTTERSQARKLKQRLQEDRAIRGDMKGAFNYLAARPDVNPNRIGVIGWSLGGKLALQLAIHEPRLSACIVNYGMLPTDPAELQKINAPVLGNFGVLDRTISPTKVRDFEKAMMILNKSVDIKIYPGARHGFANPDNKREYRPEAAADVWSRILRFYAQADV